MARKCRAAGDVELRQWGRVFDGRNPAAAAQVQPTKVIQALPEGAMAVVVLINRGERGDNPRYGVNVRIRARKGREQRFNHGPGIFRRRRPVEQHPAQAGDGAGHAQLLVQQIVKQCVLAAKAVVAPERLNAQQIHRQDLSDNLFMREADIVAGIRLPQQARVFQ